MLERTPSQSPLAGGRERPARLSFAPFGGIITLLVLASIASAQKLSWTYTSSSVSDFFGATWQGTTAVGDLDGDGAAEIAVGAPYTVTTGLGQTGAIYVFSGRTGALLSLWANSPHGRLGMAVAAAGDLDGDGIPDLFATTDYGETLGLSGQDGSILLSIPWGLTVTSPGDLDGDGVSDVVANMSLLSAELRAYSGRTGSLIWTTTSAIGKYVTSTQADVDGDGCGDLIVGRAPNGDLFNQGWAFVVSGKTGAVLKLFKEPFVLGGCYGNQASGVGDIDGDGVGDFAIADSCSGNRLYFYSGATFGLLFQVKFSNAWPWRVGDIDGDGIDDILLTGGGIHPVRVISGRTHAIVYEAAGSVGSLFPSPGRIGDVDDDDCPDWAIVQQNLSTYTAGWIRLYSGMPQGAASVGAGLPGRGGVIPRIGISAVPKVGTTLPVNLSRVPIGADAWLFVGDPPTGAGTFPQLDARLGIPPASLLVDPQLAFPVTTIAVAPSVGSATVPLTLPTNPATIGSTIRLQWVVSNATGDPAAVALSRALDVTLQP